MTVNPFFEFSDVGAEQDLWEDLIVESIQMFGEDLQYIPRHLFNYDQLMGADDSSKFDVAYTIEMRTKSVLGFSGDKEFYSQFGHQIRDEVVFTVARQRWMAEVGSKEDTPTPDEGDLIWHPRYKKLFVIKYVDPREAFYQLGKVYTWELTCEVFEYSGETIDTGVEDVDAIENQTPTDANTGPNSVNTYVPAELNTIANYDITNEDPFDFVKSQ